MQTTPVLDALLRVLDDGEAEDPATPTAARLTFWESDYIEMAIFSVPVFLAALRMHLVKKTPTQDDSARVKALARWVEGLSRTEVGPVHVTIRRERVAQVHARAAALGLEF